MNRRRLLHTAREILPYEIVDEDNQCEVLFDMHVWRCKTSACAFGSEAVSLFGRKEGMVQNSITEDA